MFCGTITAKSWIDVQLMLEIFRFKFMKSSSSTHCTEQHLERRKLFEIDCRALGYLLHAHQICIRKFFSLDLGYEIHDSLAHFTLMGKIIDQYHLQRNFATSHCYVHWKTEIEKRFHLGEWAFDLLKGI